MRKIYYKLKKLNKEIKKDKKLGRARENQREPTRLMEISKDIKSIISLQKISFKKTELKNKKLN